MRVALLVLTFLVALLVESVDAWAKFECFETPGEGGRCACVGADNCAEMKTSDSCKSVPQCDASLTNLKMKASGLLPKFNSAETAG
jgi:hypothetical protein